MTLAVFCRESFSVVLKFLQFDNILVYLCYVPRNAFMPELLDLIRVFQFTSKIIDAIRKPKYKTTETNKARRHKGDSNLRRRSR